MKMFTQIFLATLLVAHGALVYSQNSNTKTSKIDTALLCNKRIIAIGEATHGSHQEQVFKDSLIRKLVKVCGFKTILLEANSKAVQPLNSYIQSDTTVDIRNEMIRDYRLYWVWKTDEYVELLDWIRQYNKNTGKKVQLVGIDLNDNSARMRDSLIAVNVKYTMADSLNSKAILLAHDSHIAGYDHSDFISMGGYLKRMYGANYYTIGQLFGKGSFNTLLASNGYDLNDTSYVTYDISNLSKKLKENTEKETIIVTSGNHVLRRARHVWLYGSSLPSIGIKRSYKCKPNEWFDAIVFHDSIWSASNLMQNGNYYVYANYSTKIDSTINCDSATVTTDYNTTCKTIVETQFFNGNMYLGSTRDTLNIGINSLSKKIAIKGNVNSIKVYVNLFSNGEVTLTNFSVVNSASIVLSNNIFQEKNNTTIPIRPKSNLKLIVTYSKKGVKFERIALLK